jgi:MFS family permease
MTEYDAVPPIQDGPIARNAHRLLWAGFFAIMAAGIGFAIRGSILATWGSEFSFTPALLGKITGAGLTGFCVGIFVGGLLVDKIGYGKLVFAAFLFHLLSAVIAFIPAPVANSDNASAAFYLYLAAFVFAIANGTLEAVANPLVATLFPNNRTHYLNILHASWPLGLMIGGIFGALFGAYLSWKVQLALFLVPTMFYGLLFLGQKFPKSEASASGLPLGEMMKDIGILGGAVACFFIGLWIKQDVGPSLDQAFGLVDATKPISEQTPIFGSIWCAGGVGLLLLAATAVLTGFSVGHWLIFVLFVVHALVGAVELGTDSWIQNITGNILSPTIGKWLFVYTSLLMFLLRFCSHWIESKLKLSPVGLLLVCSLLAVAGLNLVSISTTTVVALGALTVYALGKTFFWPTMLAVTSDRFPRTGAVAMSLMGGIGMASGGLLGSSGLGYANNYAVNQTLDAETMGAYGSTTKTPFFVFPEIAGIDAKKIENMKKSVEAGGTLSAIEQKVLDADKAASRSVLKYDSFIPATMALIYLGLLGYFAAIGGYKRLTIEEDARS